MRKYFIIISILFFLSGCVCEKKVPEKEIEKIPEVTYPSEEIVKEEKALDEEVKEEVKTEEIKIEEIKKEDIKTEEYKKEDVAKKEEIVLLPKERISQKEGKKPDKGLSKKIYLEKWNGECLIYNLKWNLMSFGKAIVICFEEKNNFHLVGITLPEGLPRQLDYGYNRVDSFIDKKTGLTKYFYLYTRSGKKETTTEIFFNWSGKQYTVIAKKYRNKKLYSTKRNVIKFEDDIFDPILVFYFLRYINIENIENTEYTIALSEKWYLKINYKGTEIKKLPEGDKKEVYIIEPLVRTEKEKFKEGKLDIYITKDDDKIPVYFEGKVPIGKANLYLTGKQKIECSKYNNVNEVINEILKY
jgi:hypothetical protein